jgi:hypothetical protein
MKMPPDVLSEIRRVVAEAEALEDALQAITLPDRANAVRESLRALPRGDDTSLAEITMRRAMALITGEPFTPQPPKGIGWEDTSWETFCYKTCLLAWNAWADGQAEEASKLLQTMRDAQRSQESADGRLGAIHLLSLYLWLGALDRLAHSDRDESQKLWRRAMEVGSQYGTESAPLIRWTFAASFFPSP